MEWFLFNNGFLKCSSFPYNYLLEMDKVFLYDMFKSKDDFPGDIEDFAGCSPNDQPAADQTGGVYAQHGDTRQVAE
ncbi:MAG: hypothetical protein R6X10_07295 [Desulfobacterales bacterium]